MACCGTVIYIYYFYSSIVTDREDKYLGLHNSDWEYRNGLMVNSVV